MSCHVQRIPWVIIPTEVTMITCPIELPAFPYLISYFIHLADLFNLEPTPNDVLSGFASDKAPALLSLMHLPVEAEEQEHISSPHSLIFQMSFRSAYLSE